MIPRNISHFVLAAVLVSLASTMIAQTPAADPPNDPRTAPAQTFLRDLVRYMANADPRVRYGVREGLKAMGTQAVAAINEAKAQEQDPHVRAFMNRTVTLIKITDAKAKGRKVTGRFNDIDYVAMAVNLQWEQMDRTLALLVRATKERSELWAAFKEAGGNHRNREEAAALNEEIATIAGKTDAEFEKFLSPEQMKRMRRFYAPRGVKKQTGAKKTAAPRIRK